jgi:hypothetical protein
MTSRTWWARRVRRHHRRRWVLSSIEYERLRRAAVGDHLCMAFWRMVGEAGPEPTTIAAGSIVRPRP